MSMYGGSPWQGEDGIFTQAVVRSAPGLFFRAFWGK